VSDSPLDQPGDVRGEDAFETAKVDAFLKDQIELTGEPKLRQFPGGASNLTYQLSYPGRELILRRPPGGELPKSGHDMKREFNVQSRLATVFPYVPKMIAFCDDKSLIGTDFYVMEKVPGLILRKNLPSGMTLSPEAARKLSEAWVDRLADLHNVDPAAAQLGRLGKGEGYVERQIDGWTKRYQAARTRNVPSFTKVARWLEVHRPPDSGNCIIHNDWRLDNVVLDPDDPTRIVAVLDWEMTTLGDPLMDLGVALSYWIEAGERGLAEQFRMQPSNLPGMLTRKEIVARYAAQRGIEIDDFRFYEVYGHFRLAGIIQQIYKRYREGATTNPRFKNFWLATWYLHRRAKQAMR
jgi:aminoglycoside phosphotransferase (APT) family kinase protein